MQNLEQTIGKLFFGRVKDYFERIRNSVAGKIAICSLTGVLGAGLGYSCGENKITTYKNDVLGIEVYPSDSNEGIPKIYSPDLSPEISKEDVGIGEVKERFICWDKTFGGSEGDYAYSVQQTRESGYIVAGKTYSKSTGNEGWSDAWILKLDQNGTLEWEKTFGGSKGERANSIQQTSDEGYVIAGKAIGSAWVLKLDLKGNSEWDKTFGEYTEANEIEQTSDLGYIVAGGANDAWVFKLNSKGELKWDKTFGESDFDTARSIQQTNDGGYIVAGGTKPKDAENYDDYDAWIFKLDSTGTLEWDKTFGGDGYDDACSIRQTTEGGYVVLVNSVDSDPGGWILKLDEKGNKEWDKTFGEYTEANEIEQTTDLGYIVAGTVVNCGFNYGAWVLKLDLKGNSEWEKTFGVNIESKWEGANAIQQTDDLGYILAGVTAAKGAGSVDAWVFKLDQKGNIDCK